LDRYDEDNIAYLRGWIKGKHHLNREIKIHNLVFCGNMDKKANR
jgi:hypothetical protein